MYGASTGRVDGSEIVDGSEKTSSKEKGGSGVHDHSCHKISIHSKFPRHKITPKNQQFYLSIFYSSPSTKHATRHNFQLNHSNPCKLHQNDPHHTKVDSSAHQMLFIYISLSTPHINTQHVLVFNHNTKGVLAQVDSMPISNFEWFEERDVNTLIETFVDNETNGCIVKCDL